MGTKRGNVRCCASYRSKY